MLALVSGDYWVVHREAWQLMDDEDQVRWAKSDLVASRIAIRQGQSVTFTDGNDRTVAEVGASLHVWIDPSGLRLPTAHEAATIHYGWERWPRIWLPESSKVDTWEIGLQEGATSVRCGLEPDGDVIFRTPSLSARQSAHADLPSFGHVADNIHCVSVWSK
jgi:hypothetical protein